MLHCVLGKVVGSSFYFSTCPLYPAESGISHNVNSDSDFDIALAL